MLAPFCKYRTKQPQPWQMDYNYISSDAAMAWSLAADSTTGGGTRLGADGVGAAQELLREGGAVHARVLTAHAQQRVVQPGEQPRRGPVRRHCLQRERHRLPLATEHVGMVERPVLRPGGIHEPSSGLCCRQPSRLSVAPAHARNATCPMQRGLEGVLDCTWHIHYTQLKPDQSQWRRCL